MSRKAIFSVILVAFALVCYKSDAQTVKAKQYTLLVKESFPHDASAYTQGLFFYNGELYETTGQYGESSIRKVELKSGTPQVFVPVDKQYFIEGSCALNGQMFVLTWMENTCFVYDIASMRKLGEMRNPREGWGLTTDGKELIMSDGTSTIYFVDAMTFLDKRKIEVTLNGKKIHNINELEYIDGKIWANVYLTDDIVIINPSDGTVEGKIDCKNLLPQSLRRRNTDVLNGIAWDSKTKSIYLTGKNWPRLYRVEIK